MSLPAEWRMNWAAPTRKIRKARAATGASELQIVRIDGPGGARPGQKPSCVQEELPPVPRKRRKRMETMEVLEQTEAQGTEPRAMSQLALRAEELEKLKGMEEPVKKALLPASRKAKQEELVEAVLTVPQVKIVDGRIVINEESLVVQSRAAATSDTEYTKVDENVQKPNHNRYSNRIPVERWRPDATQLFYKALQQFGTDFELIQRLFPGRSRRQVIAKYKKEEKLNPRRLADALDHGAGCRFRHQDLLDILKPPAVHHVQGVLDGDNDELSVDVNQKKDEVDEVVDGANVPEVEGRQGDEEQSGGRELRGFELLPSLQNQERAPEPPATFPLFAFQVM